MTAPPEEARATQPPPPGDPWTPIRLTRWSGDYLAEKGVENGRLDAELLLAHVLGVKRLDLYLQFDRPLRPDELSAFKPLLRRRAAREPLQYITGRASFRELELTIDPRALIPRPETEILVEEVLAWAREQTEGVPLAALDLGTGTGAIALSLHLEGGFAPVVATDASQEALDLAGENVRALGVGEGVELRKGELFSAVQAGEHFSVIVSNPPYIPEGSRESLQEEVREWEPESALFAGPEGLDVLVPIIRGAPEFLSVGGLLALEVGVEQARKVARTMEETGSFQEIRIRPDLAGRERVVLGVASGVG